MDDEVAKTPTGQAFEKFWEENHTELEVEPCKIIALYAYIEGNKYALSRMDELFKKYGMNTPKPF